MTRKRLGELLMEWGVIDEEQLHAALACQRSRHQKLGAVLVDLGFATEEQMLSALACRLGYARMHLDALPQTTTMKAASRLVPEELATSHGVAPVDVDERTLTVALSDPTDLALVDELAFRTGRQIRVVVAGETEIWRATTRLYCCRGGGVDLELGPEWSSTPEIVPITDLNLIWGGPATKSPA